VRGCWVTRTIQACIQAAFSLPARQFPVSQLPPCCKPRGSSHGAVLAGCGGQRQPQMAQNLVLACPSSLHTMISDFARVLAEALHRECPCKGNRVQSDPGDTVCGLCSLSCSYAWTVLPLCCSMATSMAWTMRCFYGLDNVLLMLASTIHLWATFTGYLVPCNKLSLTVASCTYILLTCSIFPRLTPSLG
jgi:hypothetical protein